ncbi:hypothetical protein COOONC_23329, partial [Cooperia oncophora]
MDYLHTEGDHSGAGDAPRRTSFEKQDSFATETVVETSIEHQGGGDSAEVVFAAEQQAETDSTNSKEHRPAVVYEERQSEIDSQQRQHEMETTEAESEAAIEAYDDNTEEMTTISAEQQPDVEKTESEVQEEDTSSGGADEPGTLSGSVEDVEKTTYVTGETGDTFKEEHRTSYTVEERKGGDVMKEHVVVTVVSTEYISHEEREVKDTKK